MARLLTVQKYWQNGVNSVLYSHGLQERFETCKSFVSWPWTLFPLPPDMPIMPGKHSYNSYVFEYLMENLCKTCQYTPHPRLTSAPAPLPDTEVRAWDFNIYCF